jgi:hypothetical protein
MRSLCGMWGFLALFASNLPAQTLTPAQIVDNYIRQADTLTFMLGQMVDADSAQRTAQGITGNILNFNQATAQVKTLYGNPAARDALTAKSAAMTASQSRLAAEQLRLLTGGCALEGTIKSGSGSTIAPVVVNSSTRELRYFWLDYQGRRTGGSVMKPGESQTFGTSTTHPFVFVDPEGRCVRLMTFDGSGGNNRISPLLAPTVGPILATIQR